MWGSCLVSARQGLSSAGGSCERELEPEPERPRRFGFPGGKNTDDLRVRLVELTAKGRALITKIFQEHPVAMEAAAGVLSKEERLMLLRLLKKLGKGGEDES